MRLFMLNAAGLLGAFALAVPFAVFAQIPAPYPVQVLPPLQNGIVAPVHTATGILLLLNTISIWVATAFWILAAIFIFYAAFLYLTAGGDESKVERASHTLLYAVIAIVVGVMAYGLPLLITSILTGV